MNDFIIKGLKGIMPFMIVAMMSCSACTKDSGEEQVENPESKEKVTGVYKSDQNKSINLNVVYFYPKGTSPLPRYSQRLSEILTFYQDFLKNEFRFYGYEPKSFGLLRDSGDPDIVKIIPIQGLRSTYTNSSGNAKYVRQEVDAYFAAHPEESAGPVTVVFQPSATGESGSDFNTGNALSFTGMNQMGFLIDYKEFDMRHFRAGTAEGNAFKVGSELHEFCHMLGIAHDRESYTQTAEWECLMSGGGGKLSRPESAGKIHITETAVSVLDSHPLFNDSESPYFSDAKVDINGLKAYMENDKIVLEANVTSDVKVNYLGVFHDAEPYGLNKDYDAISWVAPVAEDGSVIMQMPISEFYPATASEPMLQEGLEIQMLLRFMLNDGSISSSAYSYKIVNGKPDVNIQVKAYAPTTFIPAVGEINELDKTGWGVTYISTQEPSKPKSNLIDNEINTFWHSLWSSEPMGTVPQDFIIDMGEEKTITGFTFVQRQQPDPNNRGPLDVHVRDIVIEVSSDNSNWTKLGDYQLRQITDMQAQALESTTNFRYFKVTINTTYDKNVCALAEIGTY